MQIKRLIKYPGLDHPASLHSYQELLVITEIYCEFRLKTLISNLGMEI